MQERDVDRAAVIGQNESIRLVSAPKSRDPDPVNRDA
jgi:hypothetical protein